MMMSEKSDEDKGLLIFSHLFHSVIFLYSEGKENIYLVQQRLK